MPAARNSAQRALAAGYFAAPILLTLALYWPGLTAWFQKDDFAWLGLRWGIHGWRDVAWALFAPHTEGTIRPWSHGGFFLVLSSLFGVHPLPFRIFVFLTQFVNLTLLSSIVSRLTASRAAGFWAAILWTTNSALATAMSWTMAYNVILCAFFLLLAFWLFLRYVETGDWRYYAAQFVVFVLGFGALETNLVYPALVGGYVLATNRKLFGKVIPLFLVSLLYTVFHLWITPAPTSGVYHAYFDRSIFSTLWLYWKTALGPARLMMLGIQPSRLRSLIAAALMLALIGFLVDRIRKRDWLVLLFPLWFLAALGPVLPLRDQFQTMYLTIPTIGLAMWGACAALRGWRTGAFFARLATAALVAIYLAISMPLAIAESRAWNRDSQWTRDIVLRVINAAHKEPGTLVLIAGADDRLFESVLYYRPWAAYGMWDVYLTPESRANIHVPIPPDAERTLFADPEAVKQAQAASNLQIVDIQ
ncbi:MAG TPA: glycosyltransferase family 39 protein [Bryobacteraceae bacterium]|nr:glycosyltransferase family 39 protein [Bryobacteraceae bacterium]